jgi:hypothetical protein
MHFRFREGLCAPKLQPFLIAIEEEEEEEEEEKEEEEEEEEEEKEELAPSLSAAMAPPKIITSTQVQKMIMLAPKDFGF